MLIFYNLLNFITDNVILFKSIVESRYLKLDDLHILIDLYRNLFPVLFLKYFEKYYLLEYNKIIMAFKIVDYTIVNLFNNKKLWENFNPNYIIVFIIDDNNLLCELNLK